MSIQNSEIALLIQKMRKERNISQKQLAQRLKKTSVAISDLERGKVKIGAADLSIISEILTTPIEYFYGEDIGDETIQSMISVFRQTPPEAREQTIKTTAMIVQMQELVNKIKADPDKKLTKEETRVFAASYFEFADYVQGLYDTLIYVKVLMQNLVETQSIQIPKQTQ